MICIYHADHDGECAAFCLHHYYYRALDGERRKFIKMNYKDPVPFDQIAPQERLWILDFHFKPEETKKLLDVTKNIIMIDHHVSTVEEFKDFPHKIAGIIRSGEAGCVLTYKYINWWMLPDGKEDFSRLGPAVPESVLLIGDYDTWTWNHGDRTRFFRAAAEAHDTSPTSAFWKDSLDKEKLEKFIQEGKIIEKYKTNWKRTYRQDWGYETELDGLPAFAINLARCGSDSFGEALYKYSLLISFIKSGPNFTVSVYTASPEIDCSEIAKRHGGGGHKQAAGFVCKNLPFN